MSACRERLVLFGFFVVVFGFLGCKKPTAEQRSEPAKVRPITPSPAPLSVRTPPPRARPAPRIARFVAVGDIMVHGAQLRSAFRKKCNCYRWDGMFAQVKGLFSTADVAMGNLETTLPGPKAGYGGFPNFAAPDSLAAAMKRAGLDLLTLANNHIYDKGVAGLKRTIRTLRRHKLRAVGAYLGRKASQGQRFAMLTPNGIKVAVFSYTSHINHPRNAYRRLRFDKQKKYPRYLVNYDDDKAIIADLAAARKQGAEAIIVMHHWGPEYKQAPSKRQRRLAALTLRAGADVVLGAHPHVVQPIEGRMLADHKGTKKPRLIAYSLGNFCANMRGRNTIGGLALSFSFRKVIGAGGKVSVRLHKASYTPLWVHRPRRKGQKKLYDFQVLPAPPPKSANKRLSPWVRKAMQGFAKRTHRLVKPGFRKVEALLRVQR